MLTVLAPDAFADTRLADCPANKLSLSMPFYMAMADLVVEGRNELLCTFFY